MGKVIAAIAIYVICASLTGGYYFNHRCEKVAYNQCDMQSVATGAWWPVYWVGRAGLEVTK